MVLADMSRLCRLVRSENISGWTDDIWFLDRFNTIKLPSPLKDFLERQESQPAWRELVDRSIKTSRVRGWKSREERTDSLLLSSLSWLSLGTLSKRLAGRATISLPETQSINNWEAGSTTVGKTGEFNVLFLITREIQSFEVTETVESSVMDLGNLIVAQEQQLQTGGGTEGVPGDLPELVMWQVQAGEGGQSAVVRRDDAEVGDVLDGVVWQVEIGQTVHSTQFSSWQLPDSTVRQWETPQLRQPWTWREVTTLSFTVRHNYCTLTCQGAALHSQRERLLRLREGLDGEVDEPVQARQAPARKVWELTLLDAQVLQLAEVLETSVVKSRPVSNQLRALDGQRDCAQGGNDGEIGLVKLGIYRPEEWGNEGEYKRYRSSCLSLITCHLENEYSTSNKLFHCTYSCSDLNRTVNY